MSITAVLTVYNGSNLIERALRSIRRQTSPVDAIVVVDDGSTDDLDGALWDARFDGMLIRQGNLGQGAATNTGIAQVSTSHVMFLDHDDEWVDDRVAWQRECIQRLNVDIVIGGVVNVVSQDREVARDVPMGPARLLGAGIFRRDVFSTVGPLPEDRRIHEIIDWWSRAHDLVTVHMEDRVALRRHVHGGNLTSRPEHRQGTDLVHRLRDHVHRMRSEPVMDLT